MSVRSVIRKDFWMLLREPQAVLSIYLFSLLSTFIFSFAFRAVGFESSTRIALSPAVLVTTTLVTACLLFNQTVRIEREEGALLGLLYAGYSGVSLYLSKVATNVLLLASIGVLNLFSLTLFFEQLGGERLILFAGVLLTLSLCIGALGTLLSLMSVVAPSRELLFPVLFFPLIIPVSFAALSVFQEIVRLGTLDLLSFAFTLLVVSTVIFLVVGSLLFEEAV
jgi:heme exporter protein B